LASIANVFESDEEELSVDALMTRMTEGDSRILCDVSRVCFCNVLKELETHNFLMFCEDAVRLII